MKREINTTKHEKRKEKKKPNEYDAIVVTDEWHARSVKREKKKEQKDNAQGTIVYTNKHEGGANVMCPLRIERKLKV
jgi:hypothetical protein